MSACDGNEHTEDMFDTLAVFQLPMFWLKADNWNICPHAPLRAARSAKAA